MTTTIAATADLDDLPALHRFLLSAFRNYEDHDWDHALGGTHVLITDGDAIAAHASVVGRRLRHAGRWWRTGYVESVAVGADHRRKGLGKQVMEEVNRLVRGGYELGALASSDDGLGLYPRVGWERWRGPLHALGIDGLPDTPGEPVFVLPVAAGVDLDADLVCDPRDGHAW